MTGLDIIVVCGVMTLGRLSLLLALFDDDDEAVEPPPLLALFDNDDEAVEPPPEHDEDREDGVSPILPNGGRARSGAGKCTLLLLFSIGTATSSAKLRRDRPWVLLSIG